MGNFWSKVDSISTAIKVVHGERNRTDGIAKRKTSYARKLLERRNTSKKRPSISGPKPANPKFLNGRKWRHVNVTIPRVEETPPQPPLRRKRKSAKPFTTATFDTSETDAAGNATWLENSLPMRPCVTVAVATVEAPNNKSTLLPDTDTDPDPDPDRQHRVKFDNSSGISFLCRNKCAIIAIIASAIPKLLSLTPPPPPAPYDLSHRYNRRSTNNKLTDCLGLGGGGGGGGGGGDADARAFPKNLFQLLGPGAAVGVAAKRHLDKSNVNGRTSRLRSRSVSASSNKRVETLLRRRPSRRRPRANDDHKGKIARTTTSSIAYENATVTRCGTSPPSLSPAGQTTLSISRASLSPAPPSAAHAKDVVAATAAAKTNQKRNDANRSRKCNIEKVWQKIKENVRRRELATTRGWDKAKRGRDAREKRKNSHGGASNALLATGATAAHPDKLSQKILRRRLPGEKCGHASMGDRVEVACDAHEKVVGVARSPLCRIRSVFADGRKFDYDSDCSISDSLTDFSCSL